MNNLPILILLTIIIVSSLLLSPLVEGYSGAHMASHTASRTSTSSHTASRTSTASHTASRNSTSSHTASRSNKATHISGGKGTAVAGVGAVALSPIVNYYGYFDYGYYIDENGTPYIIRYIRNLWPWH